MPNEKGIGAMFGPDSFFLWVPQHCGTGCVL